MRRALAIPPPGRTGVNAKDSGAAFAALLLFASGAAALLFQVVWIRQLALVVGVDVYAVAIGVAAFFGGLALGGWLVGRIAGRFERPFAFYAALEAAIGVAGVATTMLLASTAGPFVTLESHAGPLAWLLPLTLVAVPAVLMGGTLPVLVRAVAPAQNEIGARGGVLYAANTAGAIAGTLLAPFLLVPMLGIRDTAFAAASLNLAVAVAAWTLGRARERRVEVRSTARTSAALAVYAIAGGIALGYEVVWSQAIVPFMSTRSFAYAVMLATYLAGLALGAAAFARFADRVRAPWTTFGLLVAGAGAVALLEITFLGRWLVVVQTAAESGVLALGAGDLAGMSARFAIAAGWVVLVPTLLLGAALPLALRLCVDAERPAQDVGKVVAFNTLGGVAGTTITGFVLVPALGLVRTLATLAVAAAALGVYAALRECASRGRRTAVFATGAVVVVAAIVTPADRLASLLPGARGGKLAFYDESAAGTVAVVETGTGRNAFRRLYIQGVSNSGDAMPSLRYMRLQALLPLVVHSGEPRSVLVIGLGTGITAGATLPYPGLERRVVAELVPAVVRSAALFRGNYGAPTDPRIEIRLRDGRRELLGNDERFDVITLEPPPPSAVGVANLYSSDFYSLAASRLAPHGIVAQWLPLPTQNDEDTRSLVRSFVDVFPHASLWTTELHEMLLVGSREPLVLDAQRVAARFSQSEVAAALRAVGIGSPEALVALWVTDREGLVRYAQDAPPVTDDRPAIEYASWVRPKEILRTLPALLAVRADPPLEHADEGFRAGVAGERDRLMRFYRAGLSAYAGRRDSWAQDMRSVMTEDGDNPYYRWFGGAR